MPIKLGNFAYSTLAAPITNVATSLSAAAGEGARFPTLAAGEYFYMVLINSSNVKEIVKVTARATDAFTIVRAQEGTAGIAFSAGDRMALRWTAQGVADFMEQYNASAAAGSGGGGAAYVATPARAVLAYTTKQRYFVTFDLENTITAPTINISALGTKIIKMPGSTSLHLGAISVGHPAILEYDGTDMILLNPVPNIQPGTFFDFGGTVLPAGYLERDGSAVSRATYAKLFAAIGTAWGVGDGATTFNLPNSNGRAAIGRNAQAFGITFTADPATEQCTTAASQDHFYTGTQVRLTTTGTLPGGLALLTTYIVISVSGTVVKLATTPANADLGTAINITDAGTGVHTMSIVNTSSRNVGATGGEQSHQVLTTEMPSHEHTYFQSANSNVAFNPAANPANSSGSTGNTGTTGGDVLHNNMMPYEVVMKIIKT